MRGNGGGALGRAATSRWVVVHVATWATVAPDPSGQQKRPLRLGGTGSAGGPGGREPHRGAYRVAHAHRLLVPSATELLFALGLGGDVVAVTHECDFPPAARELPHGDPRPHRLRPRARRDRPRRPLADRAGQSIYELDTEELRALSPDLIVTQAVCAVCAVSYDDVRALADEMDPRPGSSRSTRPRSARCSATSARSPGHRPRTRARARTGRGLADRPRPARGPRRRAPARGGARVARPRLRRRPLDPPDRGATRAARTCSGCRASNPRCTAGRRSRPPSPTSWSSCRAATTPSARSRRPSAFADELAAIGAERVVAVDAAAYFSRPGRGWSTASSSWPTCCTPTDHRGAGGRAAGGPGLTAAATRSCAGRRPPSRRSASPPAGGRSARRPAAGTACPPRPRPDGRSARTRRRGRARSARPRGPRRRPRCPRPAAP